MLKDCSLWIPEQGSLGVFFPYSDIFSLTHSGGSVFYHWWLCDSTRHLLRLDTGSEVVMLVLFQLFCFELFWTTLNKQYGSEDYGRLFHRWTYDWSVVGLLFRQFSPICCWELVYTLQCFGSSQYGQIANSAPPVTLVWPFLNMPFHLYIHDSKITLSV
jgi:hypothetical protein